MISYEQIRDAMYAWLKESRQTSPEGQLDVIEGHAAALHALMTETPACEPCRLRAERIQEAVRLLRHYGDGGAMAALRVLEGEK